MGGGGEAGAREAEKREGKALKKVEKRRCKGVVPGFQTKSKGGKERGTPPRRPTRGLRGLRGPDAAHEDADTGAHQRRRVGGGVWLAGAFSRRRDPSDA